MKSEFSIVIPTYNGEKTVGKLLEKLSHIPKDYSTEIIVIDSSSTDKTPHIVRKFQTKIPNIRFFIIKKEDFNHGGTRNMGVRLAKGKYVCFFSQDAIPLNYDFLKYFAEDFSLDKKVVAVFGKQVPYSDTPFMPRLEALRRFSELDSFTDKKGRLVYEAINPFFKIDKSKKLIWYSLFNTFSCYRRGFLLANPFKRVSYGEDLLMGKQILALNKIKIYDSRTKVLHSHNFGLFEYFKREREDVKMRSSIVDIGSAVNFIPKLVMLHNLKVNLGKKILYVMALLIYYLMKIIIYIELKLTY